MKALELTVYRQIPGAKFAIWGAVKRFTDAELAAEYHANESEAWQMTGRIREHYDVDRAEEIENRSDTIRRFSRLPHYDEADQ